MSLENPHTQDPNNLWRRDTPEARSRRHYARPGAPFRFDVPHGIERN
jgi:hypothetical protein